MLAATEFPPRVGRAEEFAGLVAHIFENSYLNGTSARRWGPQFDAWGTDDLLQSSGSTARRGWASCRGVATRLAFPPTTQMSA
jgi:hypothetical protein